LCSCQLKEFGAKSNQFLITPNLTKGIESALFPERGGVVRDLNLAKGIERAFYVFARVTMGQ